MRLRNVFAVLLAASPALLLAQAAPELKAGRVIVTSDGRPVGKIDRVIPDRTGAAQSASVILDSRFVYIPASTLTADENGRVKTSLTYKEVRKLP